MADTIAVMNHGVVEQLGAPAELYENPGTTFVANFLGQSNLVQAEVIDTSGDVVAVDCHGQKVAVDKSRSHADGRACWLGVRPEKISAHPVGEDHGAGDNVFTGGRISDVSFIGVSTQYLVKMAWGQEIMVFEQNAGRRAPLGFGEPVDLTWSADHAFLLDADQDARAGMTTPEDE
jgi:spermidine/putrescine transport system ATP-binding protein